MDDLEEPVVHLAAFVAVADAVQCAVDDLLLTERAALGVLRAALALAQGRHSTIALLIERSLHRCNCTESPTAATLGLVLHTCDDAMLPPIPRAWRGAAVWFKRGGGCR